MILLSPDSISDRAGLYHEFPSEHMVGLSAASGDRRRIEVFIVTIILIIIRCLHSSNG
ncbi:hypothetical protein C8R42DRAFT_663034 [Lentinula raphanica]|nr:hypothetical protein C8R42DRAFT_663034 [Lentinula raphanica]